MQSRVAVITTVRDDDFFLKKWVDYYGGFFGRDALYVINHGNQEQVRRIAEGCNLFPIPDTDTQNFNIRRWRTQNGLLSALRQWYAHVIVCDVDEFIVVDPETGHDLGSWLLNVAKPGRVRTALGMALGEPSAGLSFEVAPLSVTRLRCFEGGFSVIGCNWPGPGRAAQA